jgi:hypothetical protein
VQIISHNNYALQSGTWGDERAFTMGNKSRSGPRHLRSQTARCRWSPYSLISVFGADAVGVLDAWPNTLPIPVRLLEWRILGLLGFPIRSHLPFGHGAQRQPAETTRELRAGAGLRATDPNIVAVVTEGRSNPALPKRLDQLEAEQAGFKREITAISPDAVDEVVRLPAGTEIYRREVRPSRRRYKIQAFVTKPLRSCAR